MRRKNNYVRQGKAADSLELIDCPYQPGNLKITPKGCLKRREASNEVHPLQAISNDLFLYTVRQGLLTCKSCPVGKTFSDPGSTGKMDRFKSKNVRVVLDDASELPFNT